MMSNLVQSLFKWSSVVAAALSFGMLGCAGDESATIEICESVPNFPGCPGADGGMPACAPGQELCDCAEGSLCIGSLECLDGRCVSPYCEPGRGGCPCTEDLRCLGELICDGSGVCTAPPECQPGDDGCLCYGGLLCREGLVCRADGNCGEPECDPGIAGCTCLGGDQCVGTAECVNGKCIEPDRVGQINGPCNEAGECFGGLICNESNFCQASLRAGYDGEPCGDGGLCFPGLRCGLDNLCSPIDECVDNIEGCPCRSDRDCLQDLVCNDGFCEALEECASIDHGLEDCPCPEGAQPGSRCENDNVCQLPRANVCRPNCPVGQLGCACDEFSSCFPGTVCVNDTCRLQIPPEGSLGGACYANSTCDRRSDGSWLFCEDGICREPTCVQGSEGCGCFIDGTCSGNLLCDNSGLSPFCADPRCTVGDRDCGCNIDRTCSRDEDGTQLVCNGGGCARPTCDVGAAGCACEPNYACDRGLICGESGICGPGCRRGDLACGCLLDNTCNAGLTCSVGGTCVIPDCVQGEAGCGCFADFTCTQPDSDDQANVCERGLCVLRAIDETGTVGNACYDNDTCNVGAECVDDICERCVIGTEGCQCFGSNTCGFALACFNGYCVEPSDTVNIEVPPSVPRCYTPCREGFLESTGEFRSCSADGLMAGCIDGMECVEGSCVRPGETPLACDVDLDCPDWQACIADQCYSECDDDSDCPTTGERCYRRVCRPTCSATDVSACPATGSEEYYCATQDGANGFCLPLASPGDETQTVVPGSFTVDVDQLSFSDIATSGSFTITNNSERSFTFTIRKVEETRWDSDSTLDCNPDLFDGEMPDGCPTSPLAWLEIGPVGAATRVVALDLAVPPGEEATVVVENARNSALAMWAGRLEIVSAELGTRTISLDYSESLDGAWVGEAYYFTQFNDRGLDTWLSAPTSANLTNVQNPFVQRFVAFQDGDIDVSELEAMITSVVTGSWDNNGFEELYAEECKPSADGRGNACFPYVSPTPGPRERGYVLWTPDRINQPVPSGVVEMPFVMNLQQPSGQPAGTLTGRIDTARSLQYSGNPAINVTVDSNPSNVGGCTRTSGANCIRFVENLDADIFIGGRYRTDATDTRCRRGPAGTFTSFPIPWLVPGFERGVSTDSVTGIRYAYECRDLQVPAPPTLAGTANPAYAFNPFLAASNPIPDGEYRSRGLRLVAGVIVNQRKMYLIVQESFSSFLGATPLGTSDPEGFSGYAVIVLQKSDETLQAGEFQGGRVAPAVRSIPDVLAASCEPELIRRATSGASSSVVAGNVDSVVRALISGIASAAPPSGITRNDTSRTSEQVHYYCEDTGLFDGGADDDGTSFGEACPAGSRVIFFTTRGRNQADYAALPCQRDGSCRNQLNRWIAEMNTRFSCDVRGDETCDCGGASFCLMQYEPSYRCNDGGAFCDRERYDLRQGKTFFPVTEPQSVFRPIRTDVEDAFRYRTRFRNRSGGELGFTPSICINDSDAVPYCYDPEGIESARSRIDCAVSIFHTAALFGSMSTTVRENLRTFLNDNFSATYQTVPGVPDAVQYDGFEKLYAELLVMLGDDSYTAAFASRFDLAGSGSASFLGTLFERSGINLSGGIGFEMLNLYRSTQYYQLALDRFYDLSPYIWDSTESTDRVYIDQETVVLYFDRLVRASSQKARAWSEIAKRYQSFNRPDLARDVVERAYTATYLESIVLSRMMLNIIRVTEEDEVVQIRSSLEAASRRYRMAMLDMRTVYAELSDETTFFGFARDYIPFPAVDGFSNAVDASLAVARDLVATAASREQFALESDRAFETDAVAFQNEMVEISNTYENQLTEICGTFQASDGSFYPATRKYAYLTERTRLMGDPCGLVGNGELFQAMANLDVVRVEFDQARQSLNNTVASIEIETERVQSQCTRIGILAEANYILAGRVQRLQDIVRAARLVVQNAETAYDTARDVAKAGKCLIIAGLASGTDCPGAVVAASQTALAATVRAAATTTANLGIQAAETQIERLRREGIRRESLSACESARIDSDASVESLILDLKVAELDVLKAEYDIRIALGGIEALRGRARRLQEEQEETEQLQINLEASRNDPNVRIYRNDSIINADIAFQAALREVYRATRVYEYYTSSSYADWEKLFLIRMVSSGDYNLENYLADLEDAFRQFEEINGLPDTRVAVVSLRDDILRIPYYSDEAGAVALSQGDRISEMRELLQDPALLDDFGYLSIPFAFGQNEVSPLTRNHKILYIEAEFIGSGVGDSVGRVYLRQSGTGVVSPLLGRTLYYAFEPRLAVMNPFFNGQRLFAPEVYQNGRLRDRPLLNSRYELVINQRDERVNQDIDLQSLTDIRLYIYYTDFTEL